jgi:hypothetical protein
MGEDRLNRVAHNRSNKVGMRFGFLTVIAFHKSLLYLNREGRRRRRLLWRCRCDCGKIRIVLGYNLVTSNTVSCGCKQGQRIAPSAKDCWRSMIARCTKPYAINYCRYGAKGITVCKRWFNFHNFIADMGKRPGPEYSIERRDRTKNYTPTNCYWATPEEQANNKSNNVVIEHLGQRGSIAVWARKVGLNQALLARRLKRGWSIEDTLSYPPRTTLVSILDGSAAR